MFGAAFRRSPTLNLIAMPRTNEIKAEKRARTLLLSHLDPEQKRSFKANGSFVVVSPGKRRYLLGEEAFSRSAYVQCIEGTYTRNGTRLDATHYDLPYCVHLATYHPEDAWIEWDAIPVHDQLLAYKIMLESVKGEKAFLKEAEPMA